MQNLWLLEDWGGGGEPCISLKRCTHIFETPGKVICIVPSSFGPLFNSYIGGEIGAVWDFVLSVSALCGSDAAQPYSKGSTGASMCSSVYPPCRRDSVFTHRTKGGRREGAGCLEWRRALSSSHRKKKAYSDPWNIKPFSPAPLGRAKE